MKTLPLSEVKAKLSDMVDQVAQAEEVVTITRRGRPVAVLVSADEYESWQETLAILSDPEFAARVRRGLKALPKRAKTYSLDELLPRQ